MDTNSFLSLSTQQLRRAAEIKEQIDQLTGELNALLSGGSAPVAGRRGPGRPPKAAGASAPSGGGGRRQMSAAGRARIAAAARARWAKFHAQQGGAPKKNSGGAGKSAGRRQMSPEARARIAAAARARWAKAKAAGKSRL